MPEALLIQAVHATDLMPLTSHQHRTYQLMYIAAGHIRIQINGSTYDAGRDSVILINCFETHSVEVLSDIYERYYVTFSKEQTDRLLDDPRLASILGNRPSGFRHCVKAPSGTKQVFQVFVREFQHAEEEFSQELILSTLKGFLIALYREHKAYFPFASHPPKSVVYKVKRYLDEHFQEEIQIAELAEKFFISKYYLSHIFKESVGYTPKQYLLLNRLSYVKQRLPVSDQNIAELSQEAGFHDANGFIRAFKQIYGITPHQYRKQMRSAQNI